MRRPQSGSVISGTTVLLIFILLTGCTDLRAVREFAASSGQLAALPFLVDDYIQSPIRRMAYEDEHTGLRQVAKERAEQREGLLALQRGLTDYMDALGRLAEDKLTRTANQWNTWEAAMQRLPDTMVRQDEMEAYSKLGTVLTNLVLEGYRRRQIRTVIEQANDPLQGLITALVTIVSRDFEADRRRELTVVEDYFDQAIELARCDEGVARIARVLADNRTESIRSREEAIARYVQSLKRIGEAHQRLYDSRNSLHADDLLAYLEGTSSELRDAYNAISATIRGR